ncbi:MAG: TolC family protein [Cyclobacteriaceae bacterium]|nr:TolC family protein [Cyclobacteriaceae bacterium]
MNRLKYIALLLFMATAHGAIGQRVLTLDDALSLAMENSPDIRRSQLNLEYNRESLNAEESRLKSNFSLQLTPIDMGRNRQFNDLFSTWYTNENFMWYGALMVRQPIVWTDGTLTLTNRLSWQNSYSGYQDVRTRSYSNNLYLSYNQPLFTYNRTRMALRELELALENAALNHAIQQLNIERQVTQSFYDVYREQERLSIALEEAISQQQNFEIIKNKAESGLIAMEERYQAEVNMANSRSSARNQEVIVENAKDNFKQLLGISILAEIEMVANVQSAYTEVDLNQAIDHALLSRMEIRQREISMIYSQNDMVRTNSTNEFRGDLDISVGLFGDDLKLPDIYETPTYNPKVALTFNIPLWDWGERKSRLNAAESNVQTQELAMTDQKNDIIINIRRIYRSLQNLENQIEISHQSQRNAQLTYDINLERYQNGDLTGMELNQYQNQLSQAKMDLVTAMINYQLELLNLKIQSLWDFKSNQTILPEEFQKK